VLFFEQPQAVPGAAGEKLKC